MLTLASATGALAAVAEHAGHASAVVAPPRTAGGTAIARHEASHGRMPEFAPDAGAPESPRVSTAAAESLPNQSIEPPRVSLPGERGTCAADMLYVHGNFCPLAEQRCLEWDLAGRERCIHFRRPSRCLDRRRALSFCMDRYEWPNHPGEPPLAMTSWADASRACRSIGKRLCGEWEWVFACEGEEMLPYPYGFDRDPDACTIDHYAQAPRRWLLGSGDPDIARAEAARIYEATPSGANSRCVSPFGVFDLTGNVDEWTVSHTGMPYRSTLQGGWWGRVRTRCRPVTRSHFEQFRYFNIGFRCCGNVPATS